MIEEILLGIEESPKDILEDLGHFSWFFGFRKSIVESAGLHISWRPANSA
jgi:hypothetical protein